MRIYVSGPITGYPEHNVPAFTAAVDKLRKDGHAVVNPIELSAAFGTLDEIEQAFLCWETRLPDGTFLHAERVRLREAVMDADLAAVRSCDAIYLLRGWQRSRGAKKELAEALRNGLEILLQKEDEVER